jgi:hypothetical protein
MRTCCYLGLVGLALLGLSSCTTGQGRGNFAGSVGMNETQLVAQKGQPQQIIDAPGGEKILVYETTRIDQMAIMGPGAWGKPEQTYYWLDAQGKVTKVDYYPYGKRKFLFPASSEPAKVAAPPAPAVVPQAQVTPPPVPPQEEREEQVHPAPPAVASPPPPPIPTPAPAPQHSLPVAATPAPPSTPATKGMTEAARLEHGLSKEDVTRLLGSPDRTEGFRVDGKGVVVWSYRLVDQTERRVLTPLIFENNRLVGWGEAYYQMVLRKARGQSN